MTRKRIVIFLSIVLTIDMLWPISSYVYPSVALAKEDSFEKSFGNTSGTIGSAITNAGFALGASLDYGVSSVEYIARSMYRGAGSMCQAAGATISNVQLSLLRSKSFAGQTISHFQSIFPPTLRLLSELRQAGNDTISKGKESLVAIKTLVLQISSFALQATKDTSESITETALALVSSLQSSHNSPNPSYLKRGTQENFPEESSQTLPLKVRGTEGVIPIKTRPPEQAFGRVIERIIVKEGSMQQVAGSMENNKTNPILPTTNYLLQDPRINTLITNVADLTSRIDGGNAGGSPTPSNSALFNMISQFQRIKTLDDVKITNATIEGYATSKGVSDSLATYLPLGGAHSPED